MKDFNKKLLIFDLDGTITKSKAPVGADIADLIIKLISKFKVAVISGGGYPQFQTQFIGNLPKSDQNLSNLFLLPTSGTKLFIWDGEWKEKYAENLSLKEKEKILSALRWVMNSPAYEKPQAIYGDIIEDRGSQITFSALGQKAPAELKYSWDPTRSKREHIASMLKIRIPEFDIRVGGATSVDVTRKGVNKAYGISKLEQFLKISLDDIIFVGDALFFGGNDYPVKSIGIDCISVKGPEETSAIMRSWL